MVDFAVADPTTTTFTDILRRRLCQPQRLRQMSTDGRGRRVSEEKADTPGMKGEAVSEEEEVLEEEALEEVVKEITLLIPITPIITADHRRVDQGDPTASRADRREGRDTSAAAATAAITALPRAVVSTSREEGIRATGTTINAIRRDSECRCRPRACCRSTKPGTTYRGRGECCRRLLRRLRCPPSS